MEEYTNSELGIMLKNLTKTVEEGFKAIHKRQDIANGRTAKNETRIGKLENWRNYIAGGLAVLTVIASLGLIPILINLYK